VEPLTGNRPLVVKFRNSRKALGKVAEAMAAGLVDPSSANAAASSSGSSAGLAPANSCSSSTCGMAALADPALQLLGSGMLGSVSGDALSLLSQQGGLVSGSLMGTPLGSLLLQQQSSRGSGQCSEEAASAAAAAVAAAACAQLEAVRSGGSLGATTRGLLSPLSSHTLGSLPLEEALQEALQQLSSQGGSTDVVATAAGTLPMPAAAAAGAGVESDVQMPAAGDAAVPTAAGAAAHGEDAPAIGLPDGAACLVAAAAPAITAAAAAAQEAGMVGGASPPGLSGGAATTSDASGGTSRGDPLLQGTPSAASLAAAEEAGRDGGGDVAREGEGLALPLLREVSVARCLDEDDSSSLEDVPEGRPSRWVVL
jgi:hypothetical protein